MSVLSDCIVPAFAGRSLITTTNNGNIKKLCTTGSAVPDSDRARLHDRHVAVSYNETQSAIITSLGMTEK
jgi:hypothetical protein